MKNIFFIGIVVLSVHCVSVHASEDSLVEKDYYRHMVCAALQRLNIDEKVALYKKFSTFSKKPYPVGALFSRESNRLRQNDYRAWKVLFPQDHALYLQRVHTRRAIKAAKKREEVMRVTAFRQKKSNGE